MTTRYTVLLRIKGQHYKFLSVFLGKDPSFYVRSHLRDEESPLVVGKTQPLLNTSGQRAVELNGATLSDRGDQTHISIHPKGNRLYMKRRAGGDSQQHLLEETELQPFNQQGFRLHLIATPAPPSHLPEHNGTRHGKDEELVTFEWACEYCPQISLYELGPGFDYSKVATLLPPAQDHRLIQSDGLHPAIVLHLTATQGQPGVWLPLTGVFGRVLTRRPITKVQLQEIIRLNGLKYDVSVLSDSAVISDYKIIEAGMANERLIVTYEP